MTNRTANRVAALMMIIMLGIAYFSSLGDSMTMDELAHLPAGYSYISQHDMRLNPEHPPLVKDMAGLGVWLWSKISGTTINFPDQIKAWKDDVNGQWDFGSAFMYHSGNDADKMLYYGRLPIFLFLLFLGFYVFKWARELFGNQAAFLALFLYSFSPTFIAHGRLVTTDVAASAAIFISLYYFIEWLKDPGTKNLIIAGLVFGVALCAKFSVVLMIPLFIFTLLVWLITSIYKNKKSLEEKIIENSASISELLIKYIGGFVLLCLIALVVIYIIYVPHVLNYPMERQVSDIKFILQSYSNGPDQTPMQSCHTLSRLGRCPAELTIRMAAKPVLRPLAQYFYGLLMVFQRASGGNTTYFLGEVSAAGWKTYFPIIYAVKEPLTPHILTVIALIFATYSLKRSFWNDTIKRFLLWTKNHIAEFSMLSFIALYWASSLTSNLNIGVRHILPTFPFIYPLVSNQITKWLSIEGPIKKLSFFGAINFIASTLIGTTIKYLAVGILLFWQVISIINIYPYYLTYFNELVGGPANGYRYATDSNLDWGQDFKRLTNWVNEKNIKEIYVDYFGGTTGEYYLDGKLKPWWGDRNPKELPPNSYLAVSATLLQQGRGAPAPNYTSPTGYYDWLNLFEPITVIGNSIFVYHIPNTDGLAN
ncbi:MAG: glycosyltransferase family 39 protein [Candidatus Portnoybacteria bacterium]|nr:glycosyltransferase family 39 protein [Candidatus Portnoybacteria bacterium]